MTTHSRGVSATIDPVKLDRLAEVAIKVGLQLQPGQDLVLTSSIAALPLTRRIIEHAQPDNHRIEVAAHALAIPPLCSSAPPHHHRARVQAHVRTRRHVPFTYSDLCRVRARGQRVTARAAMRPRGSSASVQNSLVAVMTLVAGDRPMRLSTPRLPSEGATTVMPDLARLLAVCLPPNQGA